MTSKEVVKSTIKFLNPDRLAHDFPEKYGTDFKLAFMVDPDSGNRPFNVDEWGAVWQNIGVSARGEVKEFPLKGWKDFEKLKIPDLRDPRRWTHLEDASKNKDDKFLLGYGIEIYERIHFLRGLENTWADIYEEPDNLCRLIDLLADMNIEVIKRYAKAGVDGFIFNDDWGLQDRLMISPEMWRKLWKPRYARIYKAAHEMGMLTFLHSCGYIVDILDDLIEIGLDVIHMDQQENMGLELLSKRFRGRITFFSPVDIQKTMANGSLEDIRAYCRKMADLLGTPEGGFIPRWYIDPVGAGHKPEALDAMCEEFLQISMERYGKA